MIALDANLFIYLLEGNKEFGQMAADVFLEIESTGVAAMASELVYFEVLSSSKLSDELAAIAESKIRALEIPMYPSTTKSLLLAAKLRRESGLGPLDAIHVAVAIERGAKCFITNDIKLAKKTLSSIKIIKLSEASSVFTKQSL